MTIREFFSAHVLPTGSFAKWRMKLRETLSTIASILWRGWLIMMLCPLKFRGQSALGPGMRYIRPVLVLSVFTKPNQESNIHRKHLFAGIPLFLQFNA